MTDNIKFKTFILHNQELRFVTDSEGFLGRCEADWVEQILTLIYLIPVAEILCSLREGADIIEMGTHGQKVFLGPWLMYVIHLLNYIEVYYTFFFKFNGSIIFYSNFMRHNRRTHRAPADVI